MTRRPRAGFVRVMLQPGLAGALAGAIGAVAMVATDIGGIRQLIRNTDQGWIAGLLLVLSFIVTFGSAAIGAAVMRLGDED